MPDDSIIITTYVSISDNMPLKQQDDFPVSRLSFSNEMNGAVMKNLTKSELTFISITLLCLCFTIGYFVGRGAGVNVISVEPLASVAPSYATQNSPNVSFEPPSNAPAASATVPNVFSKININTASLAKLDELPEIGPVLAQSIIDYREIVGGFKSIEQIKDVDGIGDKTFTTMKDMITVG